MIVLGRKVTTEAKSAKMLLFAVLCGILGVSNGQVVPLPEYNIDLSSWSVSGTSSGGAMATQMHVAYSDLILGVGMYAGLVYYCAEETVTKSLNCMDTPEGVDVSVLTQAAEDYFVSGDNADPAFLAGDKVYIFQGDIDTTVYPGNANNIIDFYTYFGAEIYQSPPIQAEHCMPTDSYGGPCDETNSNTHYINNCDYQGAFDMLNYIYGGNLTAPTGSVPLNGDFFQFDQQEFFYVSPPRNWAVDDQGYAYAPQACINGELCKLHMVFHGCNQGAYEVGDIYATQTGYLEVAELNNIVLLFPQAISTFAPVNGFGCWDWWGYNTRYYATRGGGQPLAMYRAMCKASGIPPEDFSPTV